MPKRKIEVPKSPKSKKPKTKKTKVRFDETPGPCFTDVVLPKEIEEMIFGFIPRYEVRLVCPLVCKSWFLMSKDIKVLRTVTNNFAWERIAYNRFGQTCGSWGHDRIESFVEEIGIAPHTNAHLEVYRKRKKYIGKHCIRWNGFKYEYDKRKPPKDMTYIGTYTPEFEQGEKLLLLKLCMMDEDTMDKLHYELWLYHESKWEGRPKSPSQSDMISVLSRCELDKKEKETVLSWLKELGANSDNWQRLSQLRMHDILDMLCFDNKFAFRVNWSLKR